MTGRRQHLPVQKVQRQRRRLICRIVPQIDRRRFLFAAGDRLNDTFNEPSLAEDRPQELGGKLTFSPDPTRIATVPPPRKLDSVLSTLAVLRLRHDSHFCTQWQTETNDQCKRTLTPVHGSLSSLGPHENDHGTRRQIPAFRGGRVLCATGTYEWLVSITASLRP